MYFFLQIRKIIQIASCEKLRLVARQLINNSGGYFEKYQKKITNNNVFKTYKIRQTKLFTPYYSVTDGAIHGILEEKGEI
jgi:hypothetical protein